MFSFLDADFSLLPALLALLEEKHVSGAAKRLNISQPAVSKKLATLREIFNDPLLLRIDNRYELSSLAKEIYPQVKDLFLRAGNIMQHGQFDPSHDELDVRFAAIDFFIQEKLDKVLPYIIEKCPRLTMTIHQWDRLDMRELLLGGIHCAVTALEPGEIPSGYHFIKLSTDCDPVCLLRKDHPLVLKGLDMDSYLKAEHITVNYSGKSINHLDQHLEKNKMKRHIAIRCPSSRAACALCAKTDYIHSTLKNHADVYANEFGLACLPVPMSFSEYSEYIIWHERFDDNPRHRWFRENFVRLYEDHLRPAG